MGRKALNCQKKPDWQEQDKNQSLYDAGTFLITSVAELQLRQCKKPDSMYPLEVGIFSAAKQILSTYAPQA